MSVIPCRRITTSKTRACTGSYLLQISRFEAGFCGNDIRCSGTDLMSSNETVWLITEVLRRCNEQEPTGSTTGSPIYSTIYLHAARTRAYFVPAGALRSTCIARRQTSVTIQFDFAKEPLYLSQWNGAHVSPELN